MALAENRSASILAVHIYDGRIHSHRLKEMEPVLPVEYQEEEKLQTVRSTHHHLIYEGFKALSKGYIEEFQKSAQAKGIGIEAVHREGRNYSQILNIAREFACDLIVLGAHGLGSTGDGLLGSTALRVLAHAPCDTLIARRDPSQGAILVGVDGSPDALGALLKAIELARAFGKPLHLASAYDPFFHDRVFSTMAGALTRERQEDIGLNKQKSLHDTIIDEGLGMLYRRFLDHAHEQATKEGMHAESSLLKGKAYRALVGLSEDAGCDLIVVGRYGHHRDDFVQMGSNTEAIARLAGTNVLVTSPRDGLR